MAIADDHFLVLGAGGLGCPALLGLVAGGARSLTIVDRDRVDASNLHRQVLYDLGDVGARKVEAARARLLARDPALTIRPLELDLDADALPRLLADAPPRTIVLECSDGPDLKFMTNDLCVARGVPAVIGGVIRWRGQAHAVAHGGACMRCVYEEAPPADLAEPCAAVGVIGSAAGFVGHLMAHLALALAHDRASIAGTLVVADLLRMQARELRPLPRPGCLACAGRGIDPTATSRSACPSRTIAAPP